MAMYLKITDGTTTFDFLGGSAANNFNLLAGQWSPNVAQRKRNQLNGIWAEDVIEALPLYVQSTTSAATVLSNLETLAALLDQARRWADGENVSAVRIQYSPNSAVTYLESVILGPPDNSNGIVLPPTFSDDLYQKTVDGVIFTFKRRGLWLNPTAVTNASSTTSSGNPARLTRTLTSSATLPSPVDLSIEFTSAPLPTQPYADLALVVTTDDANIVIVEGESLTKRDASGGAVTNTVVATASGGNVKRFNGPNGGYYDSSVNNAQRVAAIIVARNNSTTDGAIVKLQAASISWGAFSSGAPIAVDYSTTNPRIFVLPPVALPDTVSRVCIDVACDSFDIDYIMFVNVDSPQTKILTSMAAADNNTGLKTWFQQRALTNAKPIIKNTNSAGSQTTYTPWYGDRHIYLSGAEVAIGLVGLNNPSYFYLVDAGSTKTNFKLDNISRYTGYLVPQ